MPDLQEVEHVEECPVCGMTLLGMSPEEFRETHAAEDCPKAPLTKLIVFPESEERANA